MTIELKRSSTLVMYWRDDRLLLHNYALDRTVVAQPVIVELLEAFRTWRPLEDCLAALTTGVDADLAEVIQVMVQDRWLLVRGEPLCACEREMERWDGWNPAAGFFHTATKNPEIVGLEEILPQLSERARTWPMPPAAKRCPQAPTVILPTPACSGDFVRVLRERRTWRRFGAEPLTIESLATLLNLTAGIQDWAYAEGEGPVALKTSPSGGARHPIELYVAARRVSGLAPGYYHFASDRHELEQLSTTAPIFEDLLPQQAWYADAAVTVFFTAVFDRTRWRYNGPRAYRAVLLEAGHVCQTFCLTATWLGLAPFCSMALADAAVERALDLDGISESVLYAGGVGSRPPDTGEPPGAISGLGGGGHTS
jgi:SagB-type dehydrogenase family enzyme